MDDRFDFSPPAREALTGRCLCLSLRRLTREVTRLYDEALAPHGTTIGQFGILGHLEALDGLSVQSLADRLKMDQSALSRTLRPMEAAGWVRSRQDPTDKRRRLIEVTPEGRAVFDRASAGWKAAQDKVAAAIGAELSDRLRADIAETARQLKRLPR